MSPQPEKDPKEHPEHPHGAPPGQTKPAGEPATPGTPVPPGQGTPGKPEPTPTPQR
jgi:hypothetical protein